MKYPFCAKSVVKEEVSAVKTLVQRFCTFSFCTVDEETVVVEKVEVPVRVVSPEIFKFAPARFPVEVMLETVVEARVEDADTTKLVSFSVATLEVEAFVVVANKVVKYEEEVAKT